MQQKENDWKEFVRKGIEIRVQDVQREEKDEYDECDECRQKNDGWEETMNVLLNEFFPDSVMQNENEFGYDDKEFEWCEIEHAMCSRKVLGMDGMNYLRK